MYLLLVAAALATPRPGWLEMPATPSHHTIQDYFGRAKAPAAGGTEWTSDDPHFACAGTGDFVEFKVHADNWPSTIPERVTCTEVGRGRKVSVRVSLVERQHQAMFVTDGTLVMPRPRRASAVYEGPPPVDDVVVGQGKTGELGIRCTVDKGPVLSVIVAADQPDGTGQCAIRRREGPELVVPIVILTVK